MRYITEDINKTLSDERKMVFIAGPRQVGKTTLAKTILERHGQPLAYFNWDTESHRRKILKEPEDFWRDKIDTARPPMIVLDEIHKYPKWKRFLKGLYDLSKDEVNIIVTGSGRLDVYQKGGDSLFGRYSLYHLHPFTVGEMVHGEEQKVMQPDVLFKTMASDQTTPEQSEALSSLERLNGFPEPLFAGTEARLNKWRRQHRQLVIKEDLRDLSRIREIGLIDTMIQMLPEKIGSPISLNAIREDLQVAYGSVKTWMSTLERLYYLFEIRPYAKNLARALQSEPKMYLFDWSEIENEGFKFENIVALHLKKAIDAWNDLGMGDFDLRYVRDKEKREVDFVISRKQKPYVLVECKYSDMNISPHLNYFNERLKPEHAFQVVRNAGPNLFQKKSNGITLVSAARFLSQLP